MSYDQVGPVGGWVSGWVALHGCALKKKGNTGTDGIHWLDRGTSRVRRPDRDRVEVEVDRAQA